VSFFLGKEDRPSPARKHVRSARVKAARSSHAWTEIQESDISRRGRYYVHVPTDEALLLHRGVVFASESANVISTLAPLVFFVDGDGDCVFLERSGRSWSEIYAKQCRREAARR
jgi:hypothetical protein